MFASGTTNEITDDFHFDTVTLRAGFSTTAIMVTSSSGPTSSASLGPHLGTTTLSHSHSFRHSAKDLTSAVPETHSFVQKIQPTKTSQQPFLSSNVIESAVTDKVHLVTVIFASHLTSIGSTVSLSSVRGLSRSVGLHLSTTPMSPNYPSRHTAKTQTSTTLTRLQGMLSLTQNIQATKTLQQKLSSGNVNGFEISDGFNFNTVLLTSTVSIVSLSSSPAYSTSGRFQGISTIFPQRYYSRHTAKELAFTTLTGSRGMPYFTQNIPATKASQRMILSSNTISFEGSVDVYSNKAILSTHFTSAHSVSMVILPSIPSFSASDGPFLNGNKSSVTKEVSETDMREKHTIQPTRASRQRMFSSDATDFKGNCSKNDSLFITLYYQFDSLAL